jgi:hypothetical protein
MTLPELAAQIRDLTSKGRPLDAARLLGRVPQKKFAIPTGVPGLSACSASASSLGSKKDARLVPPSACRSP